MRNAATSPCAASNGLWRILVDAQLITVYPLCEKIGETLYKGYAAIRTVSRELFTFFGLEARLGHEREKAAERKRKKDLKTLEGEANIRLLLKKMAKQYNYPKEKGAAAKQAFADMHDILINSLTA